MRIIFKAYEGTDVEHFRHRMTSQSPPDVKSTIMPGRMLPKIASLSDGQWHHHGVHETWKFLHRHDNLFVLRINLQYQPDARISVPSHTRRATRNSVCDQPLGALRRCVFYGPYGFVPPIYLLRNPAVVPGFHECPRLSGASPLAKLRLAQLLIVGGTNSVIAMHWFTPTFENVCRVLLAGHQISTSAIRCLGAQPNMLL